MKNWLLKNIFGVNVRPDFANEPIHKLNFLYGTEALKNTLAAGELADSDATYIEKAYHFNDIVFAVVEYIASICASVPYVFKTEINGQIEDAPDSPALRKAKKLLERPNSFSTWESFAKTEITYNLICSKSIIWKYRNGLQEISELFNVNPADTSIIWENEFYRIIKSVTISQAGAGGNISPSPNDLIIRYNNDLRARADGRSRLAAGRRAVLKSNNAKNAANKLFENSGAYGFLAVEDENISFEDVQNIEKAYQKKHTGVGSQGKIVFTNGKIRFERTGMSGLDMQLAQSDLNDLRAICSLFGMPSQLLNDTEASTFSNYKEARRSLYSNTVLPNLKNLFAKLSWELLPQIDKSLDSVFIVPDLAAIPELQTTIEEQASALRNCEWLTPNEKREAMGYQKIDTPEMDLVYMNGQPIEFVANGISTENEPG
jgi:HK97 family phage portal protein